MPLKLYSFPFSTCGQRVALTLYEKRVPFELVPIKLGEHKAPEFVAKQPFGQVPYIDDDGFILFESRAIARYIVQKYALQGTPDLVPASSDPKAVAFFEQAVSIEAFNFDPFASTAVFEMVFAPLMGLPSDKAKYDDLVAKLDGKLDGYESILGKQKYLAGDKVTLADIFHLPYGALLVKTGSNLLTDEAKRPNVACWWKDITARGSWQKLSKDGEIKSQTY